MKGKEKARGKEMWGGGGECRFWEGKGAGRARTEERSGYAAGGGEGAERAGGGDRRDAR